jgi:hypothetical protein
MAVDFSEDQGEAGHRVVSAAGLRGLNQRLRPGIPGRSLRSLIGPLAKRGVATLVVLAALGPWGLSAGGAEAAPCPMPTYGLDSGGGLSIQGTSYCAPEPEEFVPYCEGGTARFEYSVNDTPQGSIDTSIACGTPTHLAVYGNSGDDKLDLSRVSAADGFTGIVESNEIDGGYGADTLIAGPLPGDIRGGPDNDTLLARNGVHDAVDCGGGTDAAQVDQPGVDALFGCESVDLLPAPQPLSAPPLSTPAPTGRRAAAMSKCRKLKRRRARRRCFRHARTLPV